MKVAPIKKTYPSARLRQTQIDLMEHIADAPRREAEALKRALRRDLELMRTELRLMGE